MHQRSMDWLRSSFFALSLFVVLAPSQCRVGDDSKFEGVQIYENCVLSRLSRSRFFKEHDKSRLLKVIEKSRHDTDKKVSDVLHSFVATATKLVAGSNTPFLKDAYVTVTETCSLSLPQHLAEEVMLEVQKILSDDVTTEATVLSRRREMPTTPPDVKIRRKRSPQAVSFGSFWQPSESLQTVLSNILLNSNPFQRAFSGSTSRRDAIVFARSMVESGLSFYHFSVVQEAVGSVVNAISNFPFQPEANDYAIAIANGITSVLDARELSSYADGAGIGNAMVSRLQIMFNNRNPAGSFQSSSFGSGAASGFAWSSSSGQQRQVPNFQVSPGFAPSLPSMNPGVAASSFSWSSDNNNQQRQAQNFQVNPVFAPNLPSVNPGFVMNPPLNPSSMLDIPSNPGSIPNPPLNPTFFDVPQADPSEEFRSDMAFYLYQSDRIQGAFCNGPFPGAYDMVNEGLSDYGLPVSVTAAASVADTFSSMNPTDVCAEFGNTIAEAVTNTLRDNDLLQGANAQQIVDRMASSLDLAPPPFEPQEGSPVFYEYPLPDPNPPLTPDYGLPLMDDTQPQGAPEILEPPPQSPDSAVMPPQETKPQETPIVSEYTPFEPKPPQNPDYGMPPFVPMGETQPQGAPETLQPPPQSSPSAEMPPQETKSQVEFPLLDPSFVPADYAVDTATQTGTNVPTGQESSSGISGTSDQQPETPKEPQQKPDNQDGTPQKEELTTIQPKTTESTPTIPDEMTTTATPYPVVATTPSKREMDTILKDIFTALHSLNSTSDDQSDSGSNKEDAVTTLSPPPTVPEMEKLDSSVAKITTPDSSSVTNPPETPVAVELQPSFVSTSSPRDPTTPEDDDDSDLRDPTVVFAQHVTDIASAAISMIRARSGSLIELCDRLNPLASLVEIPPLDVCSEVALIDFLLNVIKAVTLILRGVH